MTAPWSTRKADVAFRRRLLAMGKEFAERNPALGAQLRRMSYADLVTLETSLLQLMPSSPDVAYQLRCLKEAAIWRFLPRQPIPRRRYVEPEPSPPAQETPLARLDLPGAAMNTPLGAVEATNPVPEPTEAEARPAPKPDNVVPFKPYGKAFGIGGQKYWVEP